jgi:hypothetical protein
MFQQFIILHKEGIKMIEKITLDMLNQNSVSVKKQKYIIQNDTEYAIEDIWRRAYVNSIQGRQQVEDEVAEPYKSVIFMMWGDSPTVTEEYI